MWKSRNGLRTKTLVLCARCALLGIAGGQDRAPAAREAPEPAPLRAPTLGDDGRPDDAAPVRRAPAAR